MTWAGEFFRLSFRLLGTKIDLDFFTKPIHNPWQTGESIRSHFQSILLTSAHISLRLPPPSLLCCRSVLLFIRVRHPTGFICRTFPTRRSLHWPLSLSPLLRFSFLLVCLSLLLCNRRPGEGGRGIMPSFSCLSAALTVITSRADGLPDGQPPHRLGAWEVPGGRRTHYYLPSLGISCSPFFLAQNHAPRKSFSSMRPDLLSTAGNNVRNPGLLRGVGF